MPEYRVIVARKIPAYVGLYAGACRSPTWSSRHRRTLERRAPFTVSKGPLCAPSGVFCTVLVSYARRSRLLRVTGDPTWSYIPPSSYPGV